MDQSEPRPDWFLLNAESINQLDSTGALSIDDLVDALRERGVRFAVARPKLYMRKLSQPMGLGKKIGMDNIFLSVHAAVDAIRARQVEAGISSPVR